MSTRIVAGELTTDSFRSFGCSDGGSSRGLLDADVAMANAAAAVDVLLLYFQILEETPRALIESSKSRKRFFLMKIILNEIFLLFLFTVCVSVILIRFTKENFLFLVRLQKRLI